MPMTADVKTAMLALLVSGIGGYFSSVLAMREQVAIVGSKQDAMKEQLETTKQELIAQIRQVDASSQQRRNDTREEMLNNLQSVQGQMAELRSQMYKRP